MPNSVKFITRPVEVLLLSTRNLESVSENSSVRWVNRKGIRRVNIRLDLGDPISAATTSTHEGFFFDGVRADHRTSALHSPQ